MAALGFWAEVMRPGDRRVDEVGSRAGRALAVLALVATTAACSGGGGSSWYNPTTWFGDSNAKPAAPQPLPADAESPDVNAVPNKPARSTSQQRQQLTQGLVADRDNARYTDEDLRGRPAGAPPPNRVAKTPQPPADQAPAPAPTQVAQADTAEKPAKPATEPDGPPDPDGPGFIRPGMISTEQTSAAPPTAAMAAAAVAGAGVAAGAANQAAVPAPAPVAVAPAPPQTPPADAPRIDVAMSTFQQALSASAATVTTLPPTAQYQVTARPPGTSSPQAATLPVDVANLYLPVVAYPQFVPGAAPAPITPVQSAGAVPAPAQTAGLTRATRVASVGFLPGSVQFAPDAQDAVSKASAEYRRQGGLIRVIGAADAPGGDTKAAFDLAMNRAEAVGRALTASGVAKAAVLVEARTAAAGTATEIILEN